MRSWYSLILAATLLAGCVDTAETRGGAVTEAVRATARDAMARKDYAAAAEQYEKLVERDPRDVEAGALLIDNLRRIGAFKDAHAAIDRLRNVQGKEPRFLTAAAKVLLAEGDAKGALAELEAARSAAPRDWEVYSLTGIAHDAQGQFPAAQAAYRAGLEMAPSNPVLLNNLALSLAQAGDLNQAMKILKGLAQSRGGAAPRIRQNLAIMHGFKGEMAEFESLARQDLPDDQVKKNLELFRQMQSSGK